MNIFKNIYIKIFSVYNTGDFTPVCTTEFLAFTMYFPKFVERNVQLMGLSIDSVHSHLGWVYNIYKATGIEIPFPIIADRDMKIAKKYGMISPVINNASTVRSVFIIDDKQIIRSILQYPMTTGRYIPEILRIIDSLQTVDCEKVATPANWMPGLPVIEPPPSTYQALKERIMNEHNLCCLDWYLCFKEDKNCVNNKISDMAMMQMEYMQQPPIQKLMGETVINPPEQPITMPIEQPKEKTIETIPVTKKPLEVPVELEKPIQIKPTEIKKPSSIIKGKG